MQYVSSSDARNNLSGAIDMAQREPVIIQKQGRDVAVMLSPQDYARITHDNIENFLVFCEQVGREAQARGLTEEKLAKLLDNKE